MTSHHDRRALRRPRLGDYVTTTAGVYGLVVAQAWASELVTVFEERVGEDPVEHRLSSHDCRVERSMEGSSEICGAFVDGQPCVDWAARAVTVAAVAGDEIAGVPPERWASCWYHLPAAIDLASRWYDADGSGQVRLEHVHGGSSERPAWLDAVDFCEPWYVAPHITEVAS